MIPYNAAAAPALALFLAGCGGDPSGQPFATTATTADMPIAGPSGPSGEAVTLLTLSAKDPMLLVVRLNVDGEPRQLTVTLGAISESAEESRHFPLSAPGYAELEMPVYGDGTTLLYAAIRADAPGAMVRAGDLRIEAWKR